MAPSSFNQPQVTQAPMLDPRQVATWDPQVLLGYYQFSGTYVQPLTCSTENQYYYTTSGDYAGCYSLGYSGPLAVACVQSYGATVTGDFATSTCTDSSYRCEVVTISESEGAYSLGAKTYFHCFGEGYSANTIYRTLAQIDTSTSSSTTATTTTLTVTTTSASSPPPSPTMAPSTPSSNSSKVGIIVGATLGGVALFLVLAFLAWFFLFHRRKQREASAYGYPATPVAMSPNAYTMAQYKPMSPSQSHMAPHELADQGRVEMSEPLRSP